MRVVASSAAVIRLEEISVYLLEEFGYRVKEKFLDIYEQAIASIVSHPNGFPLLKGNTRYRRCVVTEHNTIYYEVTQDFIAIVAIFDTRQRPEKLTKEL